MNLPNSESINYWKTSQSSPDKWIERAGNIIKLYDGKVLAEGFGSNADGDAAYMVGFEMHGEKFKAVWPVLPSDTKNERAARIQAATLLYHDIKAKCISATVLGARVAFFNYLLLPNGRTAIEASVRELSEGIPKQILLTEV